jgi:membrane fusion protein, multidrug efflux system
MYFIRAKNITLCFSSLCLLASGLVFAQAPAGAKGPPTMPVRAVPVKVATVSNDISAVGTLLANESVVIRPEVAGRVIGIHFSEGQRVGAKAKLITLDSAESQAQVAGSSADASLNKQRMERAEDLFQKGFISQQALDEARSNRSRAQSKQTEDEARLGKTVIRAPFAGVVGLRKISPGAYVSPGQDIVRLESIDSLKLDFRIPETFLARLGKNQTVNLQVDAFPKEKFSGSVYAIEPSIDEQTRTILARARIANTGGKLRPGMFARVSLVLDTHANAVLIPEQAIVPKGQQSFVFRVVEGKAKLTQVTTGKRSDGEVEIVTGLNATDVVVTDGQMKLQDGFGVMTGPPPGAAPVGAAATPAVVGDKAPAKPVESGTAATKAITPAQAAAEKPATGKN